MAEADEPAEPAEPAYDPERQTLRRAEQAFDEGEWGEARRLCEQLRSASPEVARQARQLRRRAGIDPVQLAVLFVCLAIFLVIVYVYVA